MKYDTCLVLVLQELIHKYALKPDIMYTYISLQKYTITFMTDLKLVTVETEKNLFKNTYEMSSNKQKNCNVRTHFLISKVFILKSFITTKSE